MNEHDSAALRAAIEEVLPLFRGNVAAFKAALSPVTDSLETLCSTLKRTVAGAQPPDVHAVAMVVSRDLLASALLELSAEQSGDKRALTTALAGLHKRITAAIESCTPAVV